MKTILLSSVLLFTFLTAAQASEECRDLAKRYTRSLGGKSASLTGKVSFDLTHYFGYSFKKAGRTCSFAVAGKVTGSWWSGDLECWLPEGNGNLSCE